MEPVQEDEKCSKCGKCDKTLSDSPESGFCDDCIFEIKSKPNEDGIGDEGGWCQVNDCVKPAKRSIDDCCIPNRSYYYCKQHYHLR